MNLWSAAKLGMAAGMVAGLCLVGPGCTSMHYRNQADTVAYDIIQQKQEQGLGETEPFWIERAEDTLRRRLLVDQGLPYVGAASLGADELQPIDHWPEGADVEDREREDPTVSLAGQEPINLSLLESLRVAAYNSRDYQSQKEQVFLTALDLDLQRHDFEFTWSGVVEGASLNDLGSDPTTQGLEGGANLSLARRFKNGASLTTRIGIDVVQLLTPGSDSTSSLFGDASIEIPMLRGAGRHIVTEPLTQAERNALYAIYRFERFKRTLAVRVASNYLDVLQQYDSVENAANNYRRLISLTRQSRHLGEAGRLAGNQVAEAEQRELSARDDWVAAEQRYQRALDQFKSTLGLPTDALIRMDVSELERLAESVETYLLEDRDEVDEMTQREVGLALNAPIELEPPTREGGGPFEFEERRAIDIALERRLDLRIAEGQVYDAQRKVVVAADSLRAELTLLGRAAVGEGRSLSAGLADNLLRLDFGDGRYDALLTLDLPFERTAERNQFRQSVIALQEAIRALQESEDTVKLEVRDNLRNLLQTRESLRIQSRAVALAERRVAGTRMLLDAGRVEIRDVLDAEDSLIQAQDALTRALVGYRVSELELQRDLALLDVDQEGMWREFNPREMPDEELEL